MRPDIAPMMRLEDYRPTDYLIETISLDVRLDLADTRVKAVMAVRPNPKGVSGAPLFLDGDELLLRSVMLDDKPLAAEDYLAQPDHLLLHRPPNRPFVLTIETSIDPSSNTKLMGLYRSGSAYCTQCEADGFRRITYCLDRPDVLSVYTTRIEVKKAQASVILGNGNLVESGDVAGTDRHYAIWHDPWPKPAYLFALVAGNLSAIHADYETGSGRKVRLGIYVEPGKQDRAHYAMDSLIRSMRWDEKVFGREYDLDVFNVVAVNDFNMGAMENKGLNIFNDKYVLADPQTATDSDYAGIETVIAHEYFHNWTGNRITCRDWFQLCLKEGLTVYRDQEFSSDERSRPIKRIADVVRLRATQFVEDAGPLAHPVRPTAVREINNFYTTTIYEKGAEVIRMLKTLLGAALFARGMTLYFDRHDGQAVTMEDFIACFADVSGRDLKPFFRWYEQAGTPLVTARSHYDAAKATYSLQLKQETRPTPGQDKKQPFVIPVKLGLLAADGGATMPSQTRDGDLSAEGVFVLEEAERTLIFENVPSRPVLSLGRGFSAPVRFDVDATRDDLLTLLMHDTDSFNRWEAAQTLAMRVLKAKPAPHDEAEALAGALATFIRKEGANDPAFTARMLALPSEGDIAREIGSDVDPQAIQTARRALRKTVASAVHAPLLEWMQGQISSTGFSPDAASAGRRALRQAALMAHVDADPASGAKAALSWYDTADNLTDRYAALLALQDCPGEVREELLGRFERQYASEPLVLDKWFALQAMIGENNVLKRIETLMSHPVFSLKTPNRVYALILGFANGNPSQFHRPDGAGHDFVASMILVLDHANPQVAARLANAFRTWRTLEPVRRASAMRQLQRLSQVENLSRDVRDIVTRTLG